MRLLRWGDDWGTKIKATYEDFSQPFVIAQYVMERLRHETEEHVLAAMLTSRNKLIQARPYFEWRFSI